MPIVPRRKTVLSAAVIAAFAIACGTAYSLHPLFEDADLALEPRLEGVWNPDSLDLGTRWVFVRADTSERTYMLVITDSAMARTLANVDFALFADDGAYAARLRRDPSLKARRERDSVALMRVVGDSAHSRTLTVRLGRLGGSTFADLTVDSDFQPAGMPRRLLLPVHWFWRVSLDGDRARLTPLDSEWMKKAIDSAWVHIAHERIGDDDILLTARPAELQAMVSRYAKDSLAFPAKGAIVLRR